MENSTVLVLYGSQTGTAEDVAERITREALQNGKSPILSPMNDWNPEEISVKWRDSPNRIVIFVCSTTGQGDTPDNMKNFWKLLCRKSLGYGFLSGLNFGVIALGDSSYQKYNFVGKKLFKRLKQLGGTPLLDVCLGDDQHDLGPDAAIDPWLKNLWAAVIPKDIQSAIDQTRSTGLGVQFESKFRLIKSDSENDVDVKAQSSAVESESNKFDERDMEFRRLKGNERVTQFSHFQDTRLITIDLENSKLKYEPGDVLIVLPSNLESMITMFFNLFPNLRRTDSIYLQPNPKMPWAKIPEEIKKKLGAQPWTWESIVTHLLDIQSIPRRYFFELLSKFTTSELEKEKLIEFSSAEGQQDLFSYCNRPKRHILEVLQDFPYATPHIPPEYIFDLIPPIKARSFSIASSMKAFPTCVQILVAVVKYSTKLKTPRHGLCSNWLTTLTPGNEILVWIQKATFSFPSKDENAALIMVGPGTGCAPFRSLISDRYDSKNTLVLFFGCRNKDMDFYFQEEWSRLHKDGLLQLFPAFSRPAPEGNSELQYVQHRIKAESEYIKALVKEKNYKVFVYVAGNAKQMPTEVYEAFNLVFPPGFLEILANTGRYQTEVWC